MTLKLCQLIEYYIIGTFSWKNHSEIMHQKPVQDPFLILVNHPQQQLLARNSFKKLDTLKECYQKAWKKSTLFFLSNPISFNEQGHEKGKEPETSDQSRIRLKNKFR